MLVYVWKPILRGDIFVEPGKVEGLPLGDLGGPLRRQRALQVQRLGGGNELRTEQRPLWLELLSRCGGGEWERGL